MNDIDKLRVLLPHWIEHNQEHGAEFDRWAETAQASGETAAAEQIRQAARCLEQANAHLDKALLNLGGPMPLGMHDHPH